MSEEEVQRLIQQMQQLEVYFSELNQRESSLSSLQREAITAINAIKGLDGEQESHALMPVGVGTYIQCKTYPTDKVMVNAGSGVMIEKDAGAAINHLEGMRKEIEVGMHDVAAEKQGVLARIEQGKEQLKKISQPASQGSGNV